MLVSDFDFELPEELIAQTPPETRGSSRMLVLDPATGAVTDDRFRNIAAYFRAGDVLVLNDSRVIPARLFATRVPNSTDKQTPSGRIEVLLTQQIGLYEWTALVRPGRKVRVGQQLQFADAAGEILLRAEVLAAGEFGERTIQFAADPDFFEKLDRIGHMPLPPYIRRPEGPDSTEDRTRYQTVYAAERGSAAAPTAGLHFTPEVLDELRAKGVIVVTITLHVGLGTFQPVRVERVEDIHLHSEHYTLPARTADAINAAKRAGHRVFAAGTTTTRTLEHCASVSMELHPHSGSTSIFISPGHRFLVVDGLLTNFHLPQSTLLMLVSALAGIDSIRAAYAHAVRERYRFFSYGDCMLILPKPVGGLRLIACGTTMPADPVSSNN